MGRQLFLHHYLPAHLAAAYLAGGLFDFIFGEMEELEKDDQSPTTSGRAGFIKESSPVKKALGMKFCGFSLVYFCVTGAVMTSLIITFIYYTPITYGWPALTPAQAKARELLNIELHFSKE